jgi:hypothetical protein
MLRQFSTACARLMRGPGFQDQHGMPGPNELIGDLRAHNTRTHDHHIRIGIAIGESGYLHGLTFPGGF